MINAGMSKGIFLLQSPAQLKMGQRLRSRNLLDLAYQVALIRPRSGRTGQCRVAVRRAVPARGAVGVRPSALERRALERGYGIIVWQEQVVQLLQDVAGMTAAQADEVRRAFARPNSEHLTAMHRERFMEGSKKERSTGGDGTGTYFPRSTATTCSPSPTHTPSPSPPTRRRGSSVTIRWSSSCR